MATFQFAEDALTVVVVVAAAAVTAFELVQPTVRHGVESRHCLVMVILHLIPVQKKNCCKIPYMK